MRTSMYNRTRMEMMTAAFTDLSLCSCWCLLLSHLRQLKPRARGMSPDSDGLPILQTPVQKSRVGCFQVACCRASGRVSGVCASLQAELDAQPGTRNSNSRLKQGIQGFSVSG